MTIEDIPDLERHFREALGIPVLLEAVRGPASPRAPWPGLMEETARFGDTARAASWLRGRAALERLLERLTSEQESGSSGDARIPSAPGVRFPHPFLSLTHTRDWAIAAGTIPGAALGIGVDLELRTGMREGAERFFLGAEETRRLLAMPAEARGEERVRLWTVKEALFKANPANQGTLLGHCLLEDPGAVAGAARRRGDPAARLRYASVPLDGGGALSVAVLPCGS